MNYKKELKETLIEAVKNCTKNHKHIALAFSGGLDSSILAKIMKDLGIKFRAYSVTFKGDSPDLVVARRLAKDLKLDFNELHWSLGTINALDDVIKITKKKDPITVGVGMVTYVVAKAAKQLDKKDVLITGLGSDELFAGYNSHSKALEKGFEAVQDECKHRIEQDILKDIERDSAICRHAKIKLATPFLDKKVVELALAIPPEQKISSSEKKIILREIAKEIKLPKYVCTRPKKAAQYGSLAQKSIEKLTKISGLNTVSSFLEHRYNQIYKKQ